MIINLKIGGKNIRVDNNFFKKAVLFFVFLLIVFVIIRCAWVCDDAYITYRTADNFLKGYGLRWNISERVWTYTHPLWMFFILFFYSITKEIFLTSIFASITLSLISIVIFLKFSVSFDSKLIGLIFILFSKAFIDYSTSGLENPMTYLITAVFIFIYFKFNQSKKKLFYLSFMCMLGVLNRVDLVLLFFPAVFYEYIKLKQYKKGLKIILLSFIPFFAWELFSLFYYGSLFPNTFYAKTNILLSGKTLFLNTIKYFSATLFWDSTTLIAIFLAVIVSIFMKIKKNYPLIMGIILYFIYIFKIGGDFMSGRFFTAPFLISIFILGFIKIENKKLAGASSLLIIFLGFASPLTPILSDETYGTKKIDYTAFPGISDERGYYYPNSSLLGYRTDIGWPDYPYANWGRKAKRLKIETAVLKNIGFAGFFGGAKFHIIDPFSLGDPLLSRIPYIPDIKESLDPVNYLMAGHYEKDIPEGYFDTVNESNKKGYLVNKIKDPNIAEYYSKIYRITRGDIFDSERLRDIFNLNLGRYDYLIYQSDYFKEKYIFY